METLRIVTVGIWLAAEVVMQVRRWRWGGAIRSSEWASLVVILVAVAVADLAAVPIASALGTVHGPVVAVAGLIVAWAGIGLRLWAIHRLGRFFRGVVTVHAEHEVVDSGPYRYLRHPSYTGVLLGVLGLAGSADLTVGLVVTLGLAAGLVYRIRVEERTLGDALGEPYRVYAASTWRLVPLVW